MTVEILSSKFGYLEPEEAGSLGCSASRLERRASDAVGEASSGPLDRLIGAQTRPSPM
jgi:hypothetical protein